MAYADLKLAVVGGDIEPLPRRPFANAILSHYVNGTDFFGGNQPQICDLITFHNKGNDPNNTKVLIAKTKNTLKYLSKTYQSLASVPVGNE